MTKPRKRRERSPMRKIEDAAYQRALRECPRNPDGSMNNKDLKAAVVAALDVEMLAATGQTYEQLRARATD